jgi:hypothetical protein
MEGIQLRAAVTSTGVSNGSGTNWTAVSFATRVDAIRAPATTGGLAADGLVYRYDPKAAPDGLPGVEGTCNLCSFWLAEARLLFEQMLGYGNHLWGCTPSRPGRAARRWATSRRPSPTWP